MLHHLYLVTLFASTLALVPDSYFKVCHTAEPNFDDCVKSTLMTMKPLLKKGSKEIRLPKLDPMTVPKIKLEQGTGPVSFKSTFHNIEIKGLSNYEIIDVKSDLENGVIDIEAKVPFLHIESDYEIQGRMLVLPISGKGDSSANYTTVSGLLKVKIHPHTKKGSEYMRLESITFDGKVKGAKIQMNNLFGGNKELGDTMNNFMSSNWEAVFQELKPVVDTAVGSIMQNVANSVFEAFTKDQLFPK